MEQRTRTMIKIVVLSLLLVIVIGFFLFSLKENPSWKWNYKEKQSIIYEHTYSNLDLEKVIVDVEKTDIVVRPSLDDTTQILVYGSENESATSHFKDGELVITKEEREISCFGFCTNFHHEIIVYLPQQDGIMQLTTESGDIKIEDLKNWNFMFETNSGDIQIKKANEGKLVTKSGDIEIDEANSLEAITHSGDIEIKKLFGKTNLKSNSGDIEIERFDIKENSWIQNHSGEVTISNISDVYVEVKTSSGDVRVEGSNRFSTITLQIETNSGDIEIES